MDARAYARLPTERPNPRTRGIDTLKTLDAVRLINREDARVSAAVAGQARQIAKAVEALRDCYASGGDIVFLGAGTSGRLAVLEAAECPPTFGTPHARIRAVMAGGRSSVFKAKEGAEDDAAAGRAAAAKLSPRDALVGIAASGITPFVRAALEKARARGCRTVLVTSNGRPAGNPAEILIAPAVGPEVLSGSTRLKSATAAKLVLNTLTTAAMIGLGKVYDNRLVDLKPTNRKLRVRAARIVSELGRVELPDAERLLDEAGGSVKLAVVMARGRLSAREARVKLEAAGGFLRKALERLPK